MGSSVSKRLVMCCENEHARYSLLLCTSRSSTTDTIHSTKTLFDHNLPLALIDFQFYRGKEVTEFKACPRCIGDYSKYFQFKPKGWVEYQ